MEDYEKRLIRARLTETFETALYWYESANDHFAKTERREILYGILKAIEATGLFDGYEYMRFYRAFNDVNFIPSKPYKYTMIV